MTLSKRNAELAFSSKYDRAHSEAYFSKHRQGFWRRLSNHREISVARKALARAGRPDSILDLPCGAGRFWSMLAATGARELLGADNSEAMLEVARSSQAAELVSRFHLFRTSAFDIRLPDGAVDCIFCMRLLHHIGRAEDRISMLKEFHRVTRASVCISLWVDGNYQARRRKQLEEKRQGRSYQNRFVVPADTIEEEFRQAGFVVKDFLDLLPRLSIWRTYVLVKDDFHPSDRT